MLSQWVEEFLDEAEAFPDSRYKDQIDAVSGAVSKLAEPSGPVDAFTLL